MLVLLSSVVLLVLSGFLTLVSSQECQKQITIDVTNNDSLVIPMVAEVYLTSTRLLQTAPNSQLMWNAESTGVNSMGDFYRLDLASYSEDNYTVTVGSVSYTLSLSFNEDAITCQNLTLGIENSNTDSTLNFTCVPVSNCSTSTDSSITSLKWMKSYFVSGPFQELTNGDYDPPNVTLRGDPSQTRISFYSDNNVSKAVLNIQNPDIRSTGYYEIFGGSGMIMLHQFTVFRSLSVISDHETRRVIKGTSDPYTGIHCVFESFPPAFVTWTRGSSMESSQPVPYSDTIRPLNIIDSQRSRNYTDFSTMVDFTYTWSGGIEFEELEYTDAAYYYCSAMNDFSSSEQAIRLRVRDPLRPLWPSLGIIAVFLITALFIVAGAIGDKIREERNAALTPTEIDAAFTTSAYGQRASVTDEDVSPNRRTSSSVQLLPKS